MTKNKITAALLGVTIGDALGVPFEFRSREQMQQNPAKDMVGYGTYHQPAGTWSDDSSLMLCLAESLLDGYNLADMASKFIAWRDHAYWSARGDVFDIGMTTTRAISTLKKIIDEQNLTALNQLKHDAHEYDNGNGSLMRILPLLFYIKGKPIAEQFELIWNASALTHRHIRAAMCCLIYLKVAEYIWNGEHKVDSYQKMRTDILAFWKVIDFEQKEQQHFNRFIQHDVHTVSWEDLRSGGYVMESIEASLWLLLHKKDYQETVLSAINLGHDTDTTAAIVGGLAGLYYGTADIPKYWIAAIARMEDICALGEQLYAIYG